MTIEELREAYRLAREAFADAGKAKDEADKAEDHTKEQCAVTRDALDGSVAAEAAYLDACKASEVASEALDKAGLIYWRALKLSDEAKAAYLAALDGEAELQGTPRESGTRKTPVVITKRGK